MALHLRWLITEKFQNYETVKGGCILSKTKFETPKENELRWLASDTNLKLLHTGCPIAHGRSMISKPKLSLAYHGAIADEATCCFSKLLLDMLKALICVSNDGMRGH